MALEPGRVIEQLNRLVATSRDGEEGYRTAAERARNQELRTLLHAYAGQRGEFARELQAEVRRLGGDVAESGTVAGTLQRGWMNLKSSLTGLTGQDDASLIAECERGEDRARQTYEEVLREDLPEEVRSIVQREYAGVKEGHDRLRALEQADSTLLGGGPRKSE